MIIAKNGIMLIDGNLAELMIEYTQLHAELIHKAPELVMAVEAYLADITEEAHMSGTINRQRMVEMYEALTHSTILEDLKKGWNKNE